MQMLLLLYKGPGPPLPQPLSTTNHSTLFPHTINQVRSSSPPSQPHECHSANKPDNNLRSPNPPINMPSIMKLALSLVAFLTLALATPTTYPAVIMGERDVASGSEPPCLCYDGTPIGFYCGFEEGASPGHLTGTCDPNLCYACGNGHQPM